MNRYRLTDLAPCQLLPGIEGRTVAGEGVMVCWFRYEPGVVEPIHRHVSEQLSYVTRGRVRFFNEQEEIEIGPGEVMHFPSNAPHGAEVLGEGAEIIEIFSPTRPDLLAKFHGSTA